jgi:hypothetical protein
MRGTDSVDLANRIAVGVGGPVAVLIGAFDEPVLAAVALGLAFAGPAIDYIETRRAGADRPDETEVVTDGGQG